jgi:hypothetical protein
MRRLLATVVLASLPLAAGANDAVEPLKTTVAALGTPVQAKQAEAPLKAGRDPLPEMLLREELDRRGVARSACDYNSTSVCYDLTDRRVVYRPARKYMPQVDGLRAESVSLRHNTLVFKYTFR